MKWNQPVLTLPWLVLAAALLAWQFAHVGWTLAWSGDLLPDIQVSVWRANVGFAIGGSIGLVLGLLNGLWDLSERLADNTWRMTPAIPYLAVIPLVILWFGIGEDAKLFLIIIGAMLPIYLNALHGVRTVDPQLIEMGRAYCMSRFDLFGKIVLPAALPFIFVGIRYALGIVWLTLIAAETNTAHSGIGFSVLLYATLGKLTDSSVLVLERAWLSWNPTYRAH